MRCTRCGYENKKRARYCRMCGVAITRQMRAAGQQGPGQESPMLPPHSQEHGAPYQRRTQQQPNPFEQFQTGYSATRPSPSYQPPQTPTGSRARIQPEQDVYTRPRGEQNIYAWPGSDQPQTPRLRSQGEPGVYTPPKVEPEFRSRSRVEPDTYPLSEEDTGYRGRKQSDFDFFGAPKADQTGSGRSQLDFGASSWPQQEPDGFVSPSPQPGFRSRQQTSSSWEDFGQPPSSQFSLAQEPYTPPTLSTRQQPSAVQQEPHYRHSAPRGSGFAFTPPDEPTVIPLYDDRGKQTPAVATPPDPQFENVFQKHPSPEATATDRSAGLWWIAFAAFFFVLSGLLTVGYFTEFTALAMLLLLMGIVGSVASLAVFVVMVVTHKPKLIPAVWLGAYVVVAIIAYVVELFL